MTSGGISADDRIAIAIMVRRPQHGAKGADLVDSSVSPDEPPLRVIIRLPKEDGTFKAKRVTAEVGDIVIFEQAEEFCAWPSEEGQIQPLDIAMVMVLLPLKKSEAYMQRG